MFLLIFKELEKDVKSLTKLINSSDSDADIDLYREQLKALKEISQYAKNGDWQSAKAKERLLYTLRNGIEKSAKHYNCAQSSINSSLTNYSTKFKKRIGIDTVEKIMRGDVQGGLMQFYFGIGKITLNNVFVDNIMEFMPKSKHKNNIRFEDCIAELKLLRICSVAYMTNMFNRVDKSKIAHLLYLLQENDSDIQMRKALYNYLTSDKGDLEELLAVGSEDDG